MINIKNKESGFFLMEAMIALVIFGTIAAVGTQKYVESQQSDNARYVGERLSTYNSAVRSFLASNSSIVSGSVKNGVNWLRTAAVCGVGKGTGTVDYLPCSFSSTLPFGMVYKTTFVRAGLILTADTDLGRIVIDNGVRIDLSELSKKSAQNAGSNVGSQVTAGSPITASTYSDYAVTYTLGVNEGDVHAYVSNSNTNDAWIRTDGSNKMLADFDNGWNNIKNVRSIGVGKAPTNINGSISASGIIQTDRYVNTVGSVGFGRTMKFGGNAASNPNGPTVTTTNGNLHIDSLNSVRGTYVNYYSQGPINNRAGNNIIYNWSNTYALYTVANNGAAYTAATSPRASLNVNDIYLRSRSAWLSSLVPNIVFKASQYIYDGSWIQKPSCSGGTPKIYIIPRIWGSIAGGYNYNWSAISSGTWWVAKLLLTKPVWSGGGPWSGYAYQGIAQLYCEYA